MPECTPRLTYVEYTTWCAFEKVMNGKHHSEFIMAILNILWCPLALLVHLQSFNIQWMIFLWIFGWFCGLLHQWHLHFLKKHGKQWTPCMSCFGKVMRNWFLCPKKKVWIPSILGGIIGLYYFWKWHSHGPS